MPVDIASILLIIKLIADGIGVVEEISELAKRVQAGEIISPEEIAAARKEVEAAVNRWDNAVNESDGNDGEQDDSDSG